MPVLKNSARWTPDAALHAARNKIRQPLTWNGRSAASNSDGELRVGSVGKHSVHSVRKVLKVSWHIEISKVAAVGGVTFVIDSVVFFALKSTVLAGKPMSANAFAILFATVVSYVLNREWAFSHRGGRERRHEAALFFFFSGVGIVIATIPLWVSNYVLDLRVPHVTQTIENAADFISAKLLGTGFASIFRWWSSRTFVFPSALYDQPDTIDLDEAA